MLTSKNGSSPSSVLKQNCLSASDISLQPTQYKSSLETCWFTQADMWPSWTLKEPKSVFHSFINLNSSSYSNSLFNSALIKAKKDQSFMLSDYVQRLSHSSLSLQLFSPFFLNLQFASKTSKLIHYNTLLHRRSTFSCDWGEKLFLMAHFCVTAFLFMNNWLRVSPRCFGRRNILSACSNIPCLTATNA